MNSLVSLVLMVGVALAAPQVRYQPAYQAYKPVPYAAPLPAPGYIKPAVYSAPVAAPVVAYSAPQYSGQYVKPAAPVVAYSAPQYSGQYVKPVAPVVAYSAPQYSGQYVKPVAPVVAYSAPQYSGQYVKPVAILRQSQDNNFDGTFSYDFETENGISSQANGYVKAISPEEQAQVIQGVYSYTAPDGTPIVTRWYADETGFHAEGAHLPVTPPAAPYLAA